MFTRPFSLPTIKRKKVWLRVKQAKLSANFLIVYCNSSLYLFPKALGYDLLHILEMYMAEVRSLACDGNATPIVVKETPSTALVDARNGLGSVSVISMMSDWFVNSMYYSTRLPEPFVWSLQSRKPKRQALLGSPVPVRKS